MNIVNDGLSEPLYHALVRHYNSYKRTGYLSTTSCLGPPRKRILEERHDAVLSINATSLLDSFIGGAGHAAIDGAHPEGLHEKEFTTEAGGIIFSGRPDIILNRKVGDWKFTKVWSYLFSGGMKDEWCWQGNINSWLARLNSVEVDSSWVELVFLDWSRNEAQRDQGGTYPRSRTVIVYPSIKPDEEIKSFVESRVRTHLAAETYTDDTLPLCSPSERWARDDVFALMRNGQKRAVKLFDNAPDAEKAAKAAGDLKVVKRPGASIRCDSYCPANAVCNQYKEANDI